MWQVLVKESSLQRSHVQSGRWWNYDNVYRSDCESDFQVFKKKGLHVIIKMQGHSVTNSQTWQASLRFVVARLPLPLPPVARTYSTTWANAVQHGAREEPQSAGLERWAVDQPANLSTAKLRSLIEASWGAKGKLSTGTDSASCAERHITTCWLRTSVWSQSLSAMRTAASYWRPSMVMSAGAMTNTYALGELWLPAPNPRWRQSPIQGRAS